MCCRRLIAMLSFVAMSAISSLASAVTLQQLPYRDPAALDALLALDERQFSTALTMQWPRLQQAIDSVLVPGTRLSRISDFFDSQYAGCLSQREPAACRLVADLLSFEMRSRRAASAATRPALPVLMRPAQLPWKDTALPRALLAQDGMQWQSALASHWPWIKSVIVRYLPDTVDLHPISKVFGGLRDACQASHTEVACRNHLSDVVAIVDANRGQQPASIRTLAQIPYRDPSPIDRLLALDERSLRSRLADWTPVNSLLNRYLPWSVAIAGDTEFARARLDCQAWFPGDYLMCKHYLNLLAQLMHAKATRASPYGTPG